MTSALVILSGGQDSTFCLFWAMKRFDEVEAITFDYGQTHAIEIEAAKMIAGVSGVKHKILRVGEILGGASPLTNRNQKLEEYDSPFSLPGGLEKTFVPGRNMLFLTLAANYAYTRGIFNLVTGVCEEDSGGYPDCRQDFILATENAIQKGFGYDDFDPFSSLKIHTPLMHKTKAESVLDASYDRILWHAWAYTHTSYAGEYPPTHQNHANLLREKGFIEAGLPDPLVLRAYHEGLMSLPDTENYAHARAVMVVAVEDFKTFTSFLDACCPIPEVKS